MLLEKMKYAIEDLSTGEKIIGSLQVTMLGIAIVFIALFVLYIVIRVMEKTIGKPVVSNQVKCEKRSVAQEYSEESNEEIDNTELVAVITAALNATLNTTACNIVVKNIRRISDESPAWAKVGRTEQIGNMLQ
ncbi:MAG: OadG family protein [Clostridiales bacterium]|nr:OadG family protein [Clostridiales bacterium]